MRENFKEIPSALKMQIYVRGGIAAIFLLLFILILVFVRDVLLAFPCVCLAAFMSVNAGRLVYDCLKRNYIIVQSECTDIERTKFLKRIKAVYLKAPEGEIKVQIRRKIDRLDVGDEVIIYIATRAAMYLHRGVYGLSDYYALEVKRK